MTNWGSSNISEDPSATPNRTDRGPDWNASWEGSLLIKSRPRSQARQAVPLPTGLSAWCSLGGSEDLSSGLIVSPQGTLRDIIRARTLGPHDNFIEADNSSCTVSGKSCTGTDILLWSKASTTSSIVYAWASLIWFARSRVVRRRNHPQFEAGWAEVHSRAHLPGIVVAVAGPLMLWRLRILCSLWTLCFWRGFRYPASCWTCN